MSEILSIFLDELMPADRLAAANVFAGPRYDNKGLLLEPSRGGRSFWKANPLAASRPARPASQARRTPQQWRRDCWLGRARSLQRAANDPPPMQRRHRRRFGDAGTPPIEHPGYPASLCLQLRFISPAHRLCKMFGALSRKSSSCPAGLTYISQARRCFQAKAPPPSTPSTCPVP
jgi:hypothetical protein